MSNNEGLERERESTSIARAMMSHNYNAPGFMVDARILAEFENAGESGDNFNYPNATFNARGVTSAEQLHSYLTKMQRGGLIQSFGCLFVVDQPSFTIISYSENCFQFLGLNILFPIFGIDVRTLFTRASRPSFDRFNDSLFNPIMVYPQNSTKPFYAIFSRIDVGILIELEPMSSGNDDPLLLHGVSFGSIRNSIRKIQALDHNNGDIKVLCDTMAEQVFQLTGYDRVMVYKFHEDFHGEVFSEVVRPEMEPYLGIHYPATDIPQLARYLFKINRVRMICDCTANLVRVIQSNPDQPVCLLGSVLRAPHGCHSQYMINMGSVASLVMSIVIPTGLYVQENRTNPMKLWGLVVCHHSSRRYMDVPSRYACEVLMLAFGKELEMKLHLASWLEQMRIVEKQTLFSGMLLHDVPFGIVTHSPNIMDIVKCDGAALLYSGKCWLLGVTPRESQVIELVEWLSSVSNEPMASGFSTDSLVNSGYPGASELGGEVCGVVAVKINSSDFLFWFRSCLAKQIKWGGAQHQPSERDDDGGMHPRQSFKTYIEVVKDRSLPWTVEDIDAIRSLQHMIKEALQSTNSQGHELMETVGSPSPIPPVAYIRQQIKNVMNGMRFSHNLLRETPLSNIQRQHLETIDDCTRQAMSIIQDMNLERTTKGIESMKLNLEEFTLETLINPVVSQAMLELNGKTFHLQMLDEIKSLSLYADKIKIQQVLSDFLLVVVHRVSSGDGRIEFRVSGGITLVKDGLEYVQLEFRMGHSGEGLPPTLIEEMYRETIPQATLEGYTLYFSRKLLHNIGGHIHYTRGSNTCYFSVEIELQTRNVTPRK